MGPRQLRNAVTLLTMLMLAGCESRSGLNPVQWWHGLQGGVIAEQRPPPPNADAPYPNLGSVPAKPAMPDPVAHERVAGRLTTDRSNAQYEAALSPLRAVPRTAARNVLPGMPATAPDPNAASASLAAASSPPTPAPQAASRGTAPAALPPPLPESNAPPPPIPPAPPQAPRIEGFAIPLSKPVPPPQAPLSPPRVESLAAGAAAPTSIGFAANSAVLAPPEETALKNLALRRGNHHVDVVGFGDATDATPQVQAEAMDLALARARAIVAALNAGGVPASSIHMSAQASGRGGAARLVQ